MASKEWRLIMAITFSTTFMIVEFAGGYISGSLAVLSDAAHLLTDIFGFSLALAGALYSKRVGTKDFTFGLGRAEVVGALGSILTLWGLTAYLLVHATIRIYQWINGTAQPVDGKIMFIVACIGILVNICLSTIFSAEHGGAFHSHNHAHGDSHDHGHGHDHGHNSVRKLPDKDVEMNPLHQGHDHGHDHGHDSSHNHSKACHHEDHREHDHDHNRQEHTGHDHSGPVHSDHDHMDHDHGSHYNETNLPLNSHSTHSGYGAIRGADMDFKSHGHDHDHTVGGDVGCLVGKEVSVVDVNIEAAYLHVITDLVQSVGVALAGLVIWFFPEWQIFDPICTFLFSCLVLYSTVSLFRRVMAILFEGTPPGFDWHALHDALTDLPGVVDVHDLHVWSLNTASTAMTVHIQSQNPQETLMSALQVAKSFSIQHATVQVQDAFGGASCPSHWCSDDGTRDSCMRP